MCIRHYKRFLLLLLFFQSVYLFGQFGEFKRRIFADSIVHLTDSLQIGYAKNKNLPDDYRLQILTALSYYPELTDLEIEFVFKPLKTTMACRPAADFIFRRRKKRTYRIFINNNTEFAGVKIRQIPFNAQIGLIGHELGHVVDYSAKNTIRIISTATGYLFHRSRVKLEAQVDWITIEHNLGWQLYDFTNFVINKSGVSLEYIECKVNTYNLPCEILLQLKSLQEKN